jgi:hypothetical protein
MFGQLSLPLGADPGDGDVVVVVDVVEDEPEAAFAIAAPPPPIAAATPSVTRAVRALVT